MHQCYLHFKKSGTPETINKLIVTQIATTAEPVLNTANIENVRPMYLLIYIFMLQYTLCCTQSSLLVV